MKLTLIPPGEFMMGSTEGDKMADADEKPQHRVRITRPFYLGKYEVTQGQYQAVMSENPSWFKEWDDLPVETILWLDAIKFCNKLSERESRNPYYRIEGDDVSVAGGDGYRLPTEAEWEYAARAGSPTVYPFGDDAGALAEHAWYNKNAEQRTHPVGRKRPNAWGFHDMLGNVWEWCGDRHDAEYYASSPVNDPPGPTKGSYRLIRGGGWYYDQRASRPADRWGFSMAKNRFSSLGFRVARADSGSDVASRPPVPSRKPPISAVPKPPETVTNTLGMKLALIPAGEFMMGSPADDKDARDWEKPQHRVRITRPFYLGVHEVKQAEYLSVMGVNPSVFSAKGQGQDRVVGRSTAHYPVENVSWLDAVRFCNTLSEKERLKPFYQIDGETVRVPDWSGTGYRLPTEAEWESACRAGATSRYYFGDDPSVIGRYAWFKDNSGGTTHPVCLLRPNDSGLYDMLGNVWEWCGDTYVTYENRKDKLNIGSTHHR